MTASRARGRPGASPLTMLFSSSTLPEFVALLDRLGTLPITELAERAMVSRVTASKEVRKLAELGVVTVEKQGNRRLVSLSDSPGARAVRDLAVLACGVPHAISVEFGHLANADKVFVYGSWAARKAGERGRLPHDVDVLVVGSADRDDVFDAAERASRRIGIPVSARRVSMAAWLQAEDPFVRSIVERPLLEVVP